MKAMIGRIATACFVLGISILAIGASRSVNTDGKSLFTSNKCQMCHAVQAQGIARIATGEAVTFKVTPPDLSGVGNRHNAEWITKYLQKKEELHGEKHLKKFKGSDEDLNILATWLAAQKRR